MDYLYAEEILPIVSRDRIGRLVRYKHTDSLRMQVCMRILSKRENERTRESERETEKKGEREISAQSPLGPCETH